VALLAAKISLAAEQVSATLMRACWLEFPEFSDLALLPRDPPAEFLGVAHYPDRVCPHPSDLPEQRA